MLLFVVKICAYRNCWVIRVNRNNTISIDKSLVIIPFVVVVLFFSLLFRIENLKLGQGLGREVNYLTNDIQNQYNLSEYKQDFRENSIELIYYEVDANRLLMKFIGVDDVDAFSRTLQHRFPLLEIYEIGSFNSIATVNNTAKTLQTYFVIFVFSFVSIWTYRYRLWGLYFSMSTVTLSLCALFILNALGYIFNFNLWFTFLVVLCVLILLKSWTLFEIYRGFEIHKILRNHLYYAVILGSIAFLLVLMDRVYLEHSIYILIITLGLSLETLFLYFAFKKVKLAFILNERFLALFQKRGTIKVPDILDSRLIMAFVAMLLIIVALMSMMEPNKIQKHYRDFSKENYLIVDSADVSSFLEVQASLGKNKLDDNLLEYKISEEKKTWFIFDEFSDWESLQAAQTSIEEKLAVEVSILQRQNFSFNYTVQIRIMLMAAFMGLLILMHYFTHSPQIAFYFACLNILLYAFVNLFLVIFKIHFSLKFFMLQAMIPIFVSGILMYYDDLKEDLLSFKVSSLLGFMSTLLSLLILPIILLIPDPTLDHYYMISLMIIFTLGYIITIFSFYYFLTLHKKAKV